MPTPRYRTEAPTSGEEAAIRAHGSTSRVFGSIERDVAALEARTARDIPFEADPADWVAPVPTTVHDALRRLAASAGVHPVP